MVGWEQSSAPLSEATDRDLEGRIGAQRVAVVGILVAGRDQQGPIADHGNAHREKRGIIRHGGRELRRPEGSCFSTRILAGINGFVGARQLLVNFPGSYVCRVKKRS
jgi:hypothetical protein